MLLQLCLEIRPPNPPTPVYVCIIIFFIAYIFMHTLKYGILNLTLNDNIVRYLANSVNFLSIAAPPS